MFESVNPNISGADEYFNLIPAEIKKTATLSWKNKETESRRKKKMKFAFNNLKAEFR